MSREGGPGGAIPKGLSARALPPVPVVGSGDPGFLRARPASALVGSESSKPGAASRSQHTGCFSGRAPALLCAGRGLSQARPCWKRRAPGSPGRTLTRLQKEGKLPRAKGSCPAKET